MIVGQVSIDDKYVENSFRSVLYDLVFVESETMDTELLYETADNVFSSLKNENSFSTIQADYEKIVSVSYEEEINILILTLNLEFQSMLGIMSNGMYSEPMCQEKVVLSFI